MSRSKEPRGKTRSVEAASKVAVGVGAALAGAMGGPVGLAAGVAGAILPEAIGAAATRWRNRRVEEVTTWYEELIKGLASGGDLATARERFASRADEDAVAEIVGSSIRRILDGVSRGSVTALALLCADYIAREQSADAFFRGMTLLLGTVTEEELATLQLLVRSLCSCVDAVPAAYQVLELWDHRPAGSEPDVRLVWKDDGDRNHKVLLDRQSDLRRLFTLMKVNGLGYDAPSGFYGSIGGPSVLLFPRAALPQFHRYLVP